MNDINLLYVAIDAVSVTLLVLLAAQLVRQAPDYLVALLVSVVLLGVISYIISSRDDYGVLVDEGYRLDLGALHPLFNILRNATGGAFMLLCHVIFRDTRAWPRTLIALWFVQIFLEEPIHWLLGNNPGSPTMQTLLFEAAPAFLQTVFLGFSLYWMLSSHRADLVASRRRARILIIVVYSLQVVASLAVERVAFGFGWVPTPWQYPIHVALIALGLPLTVVLLMASMSPGTRFVLGGTQKSSPGDPITPLPDPQVEDAARVRAAFEEEVIYRRPGLTVHDLAQHLALPEYRLRNLIHEHMGFRNFNALLHHYRVEEVCSALQDPAQNRTPVLTLALSAGYQSINPFNRAFRELKATTPTAYRRQAQNVVDSSNNAPESANAKPS